MVSRSLCLCRGCGGRRPAEDHLNPNRREPTLRSNGPKHSPILRFHVVVTEMENRDGPNGNGMGRKG